MFPFLKYKKIYYIISGTLVVLSIASLIAFGLNLGIDFTGGSVLELQFKDSRPESSKIKEVLSTLNLKDLEIQGVGDKGITIKISNETISEDMRQSIVNEVKKVGDVNEQSFDFRSIGPTIGKELRGKTQLVILFSLVAMFIYILFAFRKISKPLPSFYYGLAASIALAHDVIIPVGVMSLLGRIYGTQFTIPIIAALLTILGYSINDTVVIYDRIREVLMKRRANTYEEAVNMSLNQTFARSVNTVVTTLLAILAIYFFGGETLKDFALTLIIGITSGAYSSIFVASPLLVSWLKFKERH